MTVPPLPDIATLTGSLAGTRWHDIHVIAETGSTNADLVARAGEPGIAGTVLIAGHQRTGRGRHTRVWQTPPGQLAVSAAVPVTAGAAAAVGWLSLLTGLAVRAAVGEITGIRPDLKWPNDVLVPAGTPGEGKKLSGILCEFAPSGHPDGGGIAVIGTGLNLDLTAARPPIETAACLRSLTGDVPDPTVVAIAYLRALSDLLTRWPSDLTALAADYRAASATLGKRVRLVLPGDREVIGRAIDVDDEGRIVVEGPDGRVTASAGDVTHLRPA
ncbi:biotin--[acetyl-CoA-carboxylase] ligase [Gordonia sp. PP30]|uniref:biotin--[acetyl-CoA-carboxylase] ligase n=1 Tax=Gordonia sp. PP30 TaxID=2935861 RepID=UPI001FFFC409|nr:biotin--[acetyl-CoA-carboxylase] ligase [Gordonia sp. PP30]UQE76262.1 biotin--[acetyl-CoA-carboxylase] ligase [Gordonia sp. PP30]